MYVLYGRMCVVDKRVNEIIGVYQCGSLIFVRAHSNYLPIIAV